MAVVVAEVLEVQGLQVMVAQALLIQLQDHQ
jgi:hypothetical protein